MTLPAAGYPSNVARDHGEIKQFLEDVLAAVKDNAEGVGTLQDLKAEAVPGSALLLRTTGYYTAGDGGHGTYLWNASDTRTDNGVTVIQPDSLPGTGRWNLLYVGAINLLQAGAKADHPTTDNTAFINAAIGALTIGETLVIPPGLYKFSSFIVDKEITIRGGGFTQVVNEAFGDSAYATTSNFGGSVLISTATTGHAIQYTDGNDLANGVLENLLVVGPGSGTSVGVALGNESANDFIVQMQVRNVQVANFSHAWKLERCFECDFVRLASRGCDTSLTLETCNNNEFRNTEVQYADAVGVQLGVGGNGSSQNLFTNTLFQNTTGAATASIHHVSGDVNTFQGVWIEATGTTPPLKVDAAQGLVVLALRGASTSTGAVTLNACDFAFLQGRLLGSNAVTLDSASNGSVLMVSTGGTITDSGKNTLYPLQGGIQMGAKARLNTVDIGDGRIALVENGDPGSAAANEVTIYAEDNGGGKTRLMARFPSGVAQQLAIEP